MKEKYVLEVYGRNVVVTNTYTLERVVMVDAMYKKEMEEYVGYLNQREEDGE